MTNIVGSKPTSPYGNALSTKWLNLKQTTEFISILQVLIRLYYYGVELDQHKQMTYKQREL